jgi:transcriptional regulator GlxA family with amidase domain
MRAWATEASGTARRFGSVCSGSIVLAAWNLIGDRRFASHWEAAPWFARHRPDLYLDAEAIYVEDGRLWTSAGITTGIDMTLAIVEHDHGVDAARAIAQRFVLSIRRPGRQSQFSPLLAAQAGRDGRYRDLIGWIALNLDQPLDVESLAARAGESLRSFHRNFTAATGQTPAGFVTRLKLDRARDLIASGQPLKSVAQATGYPHVARLSAAFQRQFGMTANAYRTVHGG